LFKLTTHSGGGIPDDLNLGLDDKGVGNSEAFQHFGQLHELLPPPVMLLLAEPVQRVCRKESNNIRQGYQACSYGMIADTPTDFEQSMSRQQHLQVRLAKLILSRACHVSSTFR
jgi:hypothetical protein